MSTIIQRGVLNQSDRGVRCLTTLRDASKIGANQSSNLNKAKTHSVKDESDLIDRALSGDRAAFGQLVSRYQDRLFASMIQVTGSSDDAEDIVQDAFVRAFIKLHTFQRNSQFFTWLYRIAFNSALSKRRRKRAELSIEHAREVGGVEPVDSVDAPDARMLREERITRVRRALDELSDDHRAILVLREMQNCAYEEIAQILDISIGTVRSRLSRARLALRSVLEDMESEEDSPSNEC